MERAFTKVVWIAAILLIAPACGGASAPGTTGTTEETPQPTSTADATSTETTTGDDELDGPLEPPDLDPGAFSDPTNVDNTWFPLVPGTRWVFEGITIEEDEEVPHRIIFTVTDLTKTIGGVRAVVVWDQDFSEDELVEEEIAFFAQDDEGKVWHLGQYPEEYEEGVFVNAPAWIHGTEGSKAGIQMPARPRPDTPSFSQGWAPSVNWTDRGRVFEVGSQTCVPADCYEDVLIVDEFSFDEPTFFQVKYYAPDIGLVQVGWKGNDPEGETLELVEFRVLDDAEMAEARAAALALEASAYERSEVYATTEPMEERRASHGPLRVSRQPREREYA